MMKRLALPTRTVFHSSGNWFVASLCLWTLMFSGCAMRRSGVKAFPWDSSARKQPIVPEIGASTAANDSNQLAGIELELQPPPSTLVAAYSVPARPRVIAAQPSPAPVPGRPEPPVITPQLTTQEAEAAQQQTNLSLYNAERNLVAVEGKTLNAVQSDLVSKIRSFIAEARDAAHNNDWTRARDAAKKAEVLAQQLAGSIR